MHSVFEVYLLGEEQPESWWRPRGVVGQIEFGETQVGRYTRKTANVLAPDGSPLLGEIEHARVIPYKNGRMVIVGEQREPGKDLYWRKRSYHQEWLCIPRREPLSK